MGFCSVFGCSNRNDRNKKKPGVRFHSFPKEGNLKKLWIQALRREHWEPTASSSVCTEHFSDNFVNRTYPSGPRLRENAVPTIFPAYPEHLKKVVKPRKPPRPRTVDVQENRNENHIVLDVPHCDENVTGDDPEPAPEPPFKDMSIQVDDMVTKRSTEVLKTEIKQLRWKVNQLSSRLDEKSRTIKKIRKTNHRLVGRVNSLTALVNILKSKHLVSEESATLLNNMNGAQKDLFLRSTKQAKKSYSPELRAFALTLDFYSPKAYRYVRKSFNTCLPHPRTLSKWYCTVSASPGFSTDVFNTLKQKKNEGHPLVCSLIIDEMAIRKKIEWDGSKSCGYVDFGMEDSAQSDDQKEAKDAFVFMLVSVNSSWRIPVGYFLVNGLSGDQRSSLVKRCLILLNEIGVNVISLTCDGTSSNIAMANDLGCNISRSQLVTHFPHPVTGSKVHFFLDACHMLKLVRNTLGVYKILIDKEGRRIRWDLIEKLNDLQSNEGLVLGNKLKNKHIHYHLTKMNVRLAAQTLSASVADALIWCNENEIPGFEDVEGTVTFIKVFNCLFDILNSRNIQQKYDKAPMQQCNISRIEDFFKSAEDYISNLKDSNNVLLHLGKRWTGFVGFRVCIQSSLGVYYQVIKCDKPLLKYLPMYKISQDNLEIFFGYLRSKLGSNNNPTAKQFMAAYKKILIHKQLHCPRGSNCIPLEDFDILTCSSSPLVRINSSTPLARHDEADETDTSTQPSKRKNAHYDGCIAEEHNYAVQITPQNLSLFTKEVVGHIAGFVVRGIKEKLLCSTCISALFDESKFQASLTSIKNRGGLTFPSKDVVIVCNYVESRLRQFLLSEGLSKFNSKIALKIAYETLGRLVPDGIFSVLDEHSLNQSVLDNHLINLIKLICEKYINIRIHHAAKLETERLHPRSVRQHNLKTTLFMGQ